MGGAQPLAATMAGASMLAIECDPARIEKRLRDALSRRRAESLDEALALIDESKRTKMPVSVGVLGNAAEIVPELVRRGVRPDAVTDQTSAHDPVNGYLPAGWTLEQWRERARARSADASRRPRSARWSTHVEAMARASTGSGVPTFDYGNNIRQMAFDAGLADAFAFPGFVPAYIRPLFCRGVGPFRWVALSGDPDDIAKTDAKVKELLPHDAPPASLARHGARADRVPRPAGAHLLDRSGRPRSRRARVQRDGRARRAARRRSSSAAITSTAAASRRPTARPKAMKDGTDAVSDWPLLNAMLNVAGGASWVSIHHGGGVGIGFSQHAGIVIVADGTEAAAKRIARVLWNDPASGVARHADAGYDDALACAREHGLRCRCIVAPGE